MTVTLATPEGGIAFRGFFRIEYVRLDRRFAFFNRQFRGGAGSVFSLRIHAVAMSVKRYNVMHASIPRG